MPLVSIVIPAFKAGRFIKRALGGIVAQTHTEWEVIVVEDGTHDETESIVREFATTTSQSVRYENNGSNLGVSATRNRAMAQARGDVIAFLDADDRWTPDHLASGLETLHKGADICFSGFYIFDESSQQCVGSSVPDLSLFGNLLSSLFESNFIQTSSLVMVCSAVAKDAGRFDEELKVGEDCDYWMRILSRGGKLACTGKLTCYYAKHGTSAMANTLMVADHAVKFYRKHLKSDFLPSDLRERYYATSLWNHGRLVRQQNPSLARTRFIEAWLHRPLDFRYFAYMMRSCILRS